MTIGLLWHSVLFGLAVDLVSLESICVRVARGDQSDTHDRFDQDSQ